MEAKAVNVTTSAVSSMALHYHRIVKQYGMADVGLLQGKLLSPLSMSVLGNAPKKAIENLPFDPNEIEWDFTNRFVTCKPKWAIECVKKFVKVCQREKLKIDSNIPKGEHINNGQGRL